MIPALLVCAFALVPPRFDAEGMPLPAEVMHRVGSARFRHHVGLVDPVASADARVLFTPTLAADVVAWEADTGRMLHRFELPFVDVPDQLRRRGGPAFVDQIPRNYHYGNRRLTRTADGLLRVVDLYAGSGTVRTVDPATGRVVETVPFNIPLAWRVEASPDGRLLAAHVIDVSRNASLDMERHFLKVRDLHTNAAAYEVAVAGHLHSYAFSPDGKRLAVADDETFRLLDAATGKAVRTVETWYARRVSWLHFAPDSTAVAVWVRGSKPTLDRLEIWPTAGGPEVATGLELPSQRNPWAARDVVFRPDGRQMAVNTDDTTWRLVDARTGKAGAAVVVASRTYGAAYAPDGRRLYAAGVGHVPDGWSGLNHAGFVVPVDVSADPPVVPPVRPFAHHGTFTRTGDYVAVHEAEEVRWHAATGRTTVTKLPVKVEGAYPTLAFSPDGERFALSTAQAVKRRAAVEVVDLATGRRTSFAPGKAGAAPLAFSPDGILIAHTEDGLTGWPPDAGPATVRPVPPDPKGGWQCNSGFDGRWLWTEPMMPLVERPPPPTTPIRLYDLRNLKAPLWEFVPPSWGYMGAVSADGRQLVRVAYTVGTSIELWEGPPARRRWQVRSDTTPRLISPDGRTLVGTTGAAIELIEVATGRVRHTFVGHRGAVGEVRPGAFSPDGRLLATTSPEAPVYLWDVRGELQKPATPDLSAAWADLASTDAAVAFRAVRRLAWFPEQALPLLRAKLPPVPAVDAAQVAAFVAALDAPAFTDRQAATKGLKEIGDRAVPALEAALTATASAEVRTRIEALLEANANLPHHADDLRAVRAVEAVEWIGTPAARALLQAWASGAAGARLTREAKESVRQPTGM